MRARRDSSLSALALLLAALALGHAVQLANGAYTPDAMVWVSVALGLTLFAVAAPQTDEWVSHGVLGLTLAAGTAGVAREIYVHLTTMPGIYLRVGNDAFAEHHRYVAVAAVLAGALVALDRGVTRALA